MPCQERRRLRHHHSRGSSGKCTRSPSWECSWSVPRRSNCQAVRGRASPTWTTARLGRMTARGRKVPTARHHNRGKTLTSSGCTRSSRETRGRTRAGCRRTVQMGKYRRQIRRHQLLQQRWRHQGDEARQLKAGMPTAMHHRHHHPPDHCSRGGCRTDGTCRSGAAHFRGIRSQPGTIRRRGCERA